MKRGRCVPRHAPAQLAFAGLDWIADGVIGLADGSIRAVLEVRGGDLGQQAPETQEAALAGFAAVLNSLDYPIQVLTRALPNDLERHAADLDRRAQHELAGPLAELAWDQASFARRLAHERTLLEHRVYVVIPAPTTPRGSERVGMIRLPWVLRRGVLRRGGRQGDQAADEAVCRQQLTARCEELVRQLARCDVAATRLGDVALARLLASCWCADASGLGRVSGLLSDYQAAVVRGAPAATAPATCPAPAARRNS